MVKNEHRRGTVDGWLQDGNTLLETLGSQSEGESFVVQRFVNDAMTIGSKRFVATMPTLLLGASGPVLPSKEVLITRCAGERGSTIHFACLPITKEVERNAVEAPQSRSLRDRSKTNLLRCARPPLKI